MIQDESWQEILVLAEKLIQRLTHQLSKSLGNSPGQQQPLSLIRQRIWLAGLTGLVLWVINWKLVLALASGFGALKWLNWLNQKHWLPSELPPQRCLSPVNQPQTWPQTWVVGGSAVATFGVYMSASILVEADSYWIAAEILLQGLITFAIFCLLIWQIGHSHSQKSLDLEQSLREMTHAEPLKRLIAVRQMTRLVTQIDPEQIYLTDSQLSLRSHLTDCFRLMLRQEPDPIVRAAARESLQLISPKPQLPKGCEPLAPAITLKRSAIHRHRHQVEYVEP